MLKKPTRSANSIKTAETKNSAPIRLVLFNPEAYKVCVAGSFNNWQPGAMPLKASGHGRWVKDLSLPPGRYEYQFVVDGRWVPDWTAQEEIENPFGGVNSVVEVAPAKAQPTQTKPVNDRGPATSEPMLAVVKKERGLCL